MVDVSDIWDDDEDMIMHGACLDNDPDNCLACGVRVRHHVNSDYCAECNDKDDEDET